MFARFVLPVVLFVFANATVRADVTRIGFGSCAHQDRPQPIWDVISQMRPDVFLLIGDNIYGDTTDMEVMRGKYQKLGAIPGFQRVRKESRLLGVWDDHDYGQNNAGLEYPKKRESQQVFLDFFGVAKDSPRRKQEGVYHAEIHGKPGKRVQYIMLDTRYFRSPFLMAKDPASDREFVVPHTNTTATILGEAQWKWLEEQLRLPAELRLISSGIQIVPHDHGGEKWMNFPHERKRLFNLIKETGANGVVFLSGDRHMAELSVVNGEAGYPLFDLTSSGLNQGRPTYRPLEVNRYRMATMNFGNNFGWIEMDWDSSILRLEIRDEQGDVRIRQKLPLGVLSAPAKN